MQEAVRLLVESQDPVLLHHGVPWWGEGHPSTPRADHWAHQALHWLQTAGRRGAVHLLDLPHLLMPLVLWGNPYGYLLWESRKVDRPAITLTLMEHVQFIY